MILIHVKSTLYFCCIFSVLLFLIYIGKEMNRSNPRVSVIIPCYNHERFIREAIKSVIDQDYSNIELIVIDDGSSDSSVEVIQEMIPECQERFARFEFRHRPNVGICLTLNEALEWCEGEFLSGVASDDTLRRYKTSVQVDYLLRNTESIGVFGGVEVVHEDTGIREDRLKPASKFKFEDIFLRRHSVQASTSLLRTDAVRKLGGYQEAFFIEDWLLWLLLTEHGGTLDYINMVFGVYRRHQGNASSQLEKMKDARLQIVELFNKQPLYKKSLAMVYVASAHEWQSTDFKKSLSYMLKAIKYDNSLIFRPFMARFFLKYITFIKK